MRDISGVQETIWLTQNIYAGSALFNIGGYAVIEGALNVDLLVTVITDVLNKVDVIETGYYAFNDEALYGNTRFKKWDVSVIDFSADNGADDACLNWMLSDMNMPFDVTENLLKIAILTSGTKFYWYTKAHHLIFDGYSMALFFNKVADAYTACLFDQKENKTNELFSYADFVLDYKKYRLSESYQVDREFWKNRLSAGDQMGKAFASVSRQGVKTSLASERQQLTISRDLYDRIDSFCKEQHCTVFHYFVAALFVLNKLYNNDTPFIGLPVFNRQNKKFKNTPGTFVNTLPFSVTISHEDSFIQVLRSVKNELSTCYKHLRFPLYDMLQALDHAGNIYTVSFSYQKNNYGTQIGNAAIDIHYIPAPEQQEDLVFHLLEYAAAEDLTLCVDHSIELFDEEVVQKLLGHYHNLLQVLYTEPAVPVGLVNYLHAAEKHQLLTVFNDTAFEYAREKTLVSLFEEQASKTPESIALVFGDTSLTWRQLNERSNQLAGYLKAHYRLQADDLIGVMLNRSEWMIIAILGVLKSGAAYVPIDPAYPAERIEYILSNSGCKTVIDEAGLNRFEEQAGEYGIENTNNSRPGDLAYVIYTSGSTGRPKGAMLEHGGVVNRIEWMWKQYGFDSNDIVLQKTTFTFDVSVWEIFLPLCYGARLVLCSREQAGSPEAIVDLIAAHGITCLHFVPGMFNAFISWIQEDKKIQERLKTVRAVITSGERLGLETIKKWYELAEIPVHNLYGPTEASVDVTHYSTNRQTDKVLIGRPIWNTQLYITGWAGQLVPVGVPGEICIGGVGLARGYIQAAELTAEKFVSNPYRPGERLYRTGDQGRWLPDGNIEFLGRTDDQVKIRGYRIELGEIEHVLGMHPEIEVAVVLARPNAGGDNDLVACIQSKTAMQVGELRLWLGLRLPAYMIPSQYVQLEQLPVTANGKTDKRKLMEISGGELLTGVEYIEPRSTTEERLVAIWKEVLQRERIGVKDNFFELGGDSLKIVKMVQMLKRKFDKQVTVVTAFRFPTIEALSEYLDVITNDHTEESDEEMRLAMSIREGVINLVNHENNAE